MEGRMSRLLYGAHVQANGIRQHYLRYGGDDGERAQRDSIVLIPGITSPAVTWGFVAERFGMHFDTYVLDVRGRGLSEASAALDYSLDAQVADVIAFVQTIGLQRYSLVGHSMGGRIAIRAAAARPAGLTRLVAIDPPMSGPGRRGYPATLSWYVDSMREARRGISLQRMREFCPTWTESQLRIRAQWLHTCDERAVVASFEGFHLDDVHLDLPKIKVPLLLMTAGRGDVVQPEDATEIKELLPHVLVAQVLNAGHMIPWDDEEGFYRGFGEFLGAPLSADVRSESHGRQ